MEAKASCRCMLMISRNIAFTTLQIAYLKARPSLDKGTEDFLLWHWQVVSSSCSSFTMAKVKPIKSYNQLTYS
jgi:hypothetical protein